MRAPWYRRKNACVGRHRLCHTDRPMSQGIWVGRWSLWALGWVSLLGAAAASAGPSQTTVAVASQNPAGMAIDADDRLHFSWESTRGELHYTRIDGRKKTSQLVDDTKDAGRWSAIAVDSAGNPYIVYYSNPQNPAHVGLRVA